MSGWIGGAALGLGIYAGVSLIAGPLIGRGLRVLNSQHHRSLSQEQASRDGQSDRLGRVSDGAEIDNFHTTLVASQE